ncbi:MAG: hypothetical protein ACK55X_12070 [Synechococcaceae cyanobacterium]
MALATAGCFLSFSSAQPVNAEYVKNGGFSINSIAGVYDSSFINGTQAVTIEDWSVSTSYSFGHLENLVFAATKIDHTRQHRGGLARAID